LTLLRCFVDQSNLRFGSGLAVKRIEDELLLKGEGRYTDDVSHEHQQHVYFVRSPHPHAKILKIDTQAARSMPGVLAVLTAEDLLKAGVKPMAKPVNFKRADGSPIASATRYFLATERVRFVGEMVAAVVASSVHEAKNAAEAVFVDYEPLPNAVTLDEALAPNAPLLCENNDNIVAETRYGDAQKAQEAFAQAAHVVSLQIINQRVVALTLEPRSVQAYIEEDRLVVRMSSQMPTALRTQVSDLFNISAENIRVIVGDVGGGFGMKTGAYAEDLAVAFCSHHLRVPVKWQAERGEDFLSSTHGRDIESRAEMAIDATGKVLALRIHNRANVGAYPGMTGVAIQILIGPWVQTSVYDIGLIDFHFTTVMTNTAPTGAYRGAGRPEAIFNIERLMDEAARVSGIDRVELRRRNFVKPEQMPYKNAMGQTYDTGHFESIMDQALSLSDWSGFEARAKASLAKGRWRGLGIATFLEWTGGNALEEKVNVRIMADGVIEVFTAVNAMGQGIATTLAQLVVDVFGVDISRVRVVMGDTDRGNGFGSVGSRSLFTGGSAVSVGAQLALDKAKDLAAKSLEASADDLRYEQGSFLVAGTDLKISLAELAGKEPMGRIELDSSTSASGPTWPNGCHISEIELDPQTGEIEICRYSSMNDVGRVVTPMIVQGQLDGGAVQGIGQALYEEMIYDSETGQPLSGSLMDYAIPHADVMPSMFVTQMDTSIPCKNNVLGVKGVGELGTIGATPSIVNAVADALARNGQAKKSAHLQMPLTPHKMWSLLNSH
jgi:carbon-monoxide dehydrogenase large subunit